MLGPLEEALAGSPDALPQRREDLALVHRNSLRLLRLVNTLLDFSRIEAGRVQASYEPVDLSSYTAELASVFRAAVEKAGLKLTVDCPCQGEPVWIDRDMWEKIVLNLLSNASNSPLRAASPRACGSKTRVRCWKSRTPASAFPNTRSRACSTASIAWREFVVAHTKAPALVWRWCKS